MECFYVALGLLALAVLLMPIVLAPPAWRRARGLEGRLDEMARQLVALELRLKRAERREEPVAAPPAAAPDVAPLQVETAVHAPEPTPVPVAESAPAEPPEPPRVEAPPSPPFQPVEPPAPSAPAAAAGRGGFAGLEKSLGTRLPIWLGAIALALAGIYLVKYSFDQGWISPAIRISAGVLFGLVLLADGEILRRRSTRIAEALSAAGVADLFACFLAGIHVYQLITPGVGIVLMILATAVAVGLSLRQGPIVAIV